MQNQCQRSVGSKDRVETNIQMGQLHFLHANVVGNDTKCIVEFLKGGHMI